MTDFKKLFDSLSSCKVGVIGDVMLDTYMWGQVERISPEAPVPVVTLQQKEYRIGGAGNVALNCRSLQANVSLLSVTGDDEEALRLEQLLEEKQIGSSWLVKSKERITTNKTRIISRNQQMMRLDNEITRDLSAADNAALLANIKSYIKTEKPGVIIFEDYNKGVLTEPLIAAVIKECRNAGIITAVDPKRKNFFSYRGVDIFKPNLKEVKEGLNLLFDEVDEKLLMNIHAELFRIIGHRISFITLSDKGVFYQLDGEARIIPSHLRNVADVSGAGDTVIAVASLLYAGSGDVSLMAEVANIAGGLVCEEVGTVAIDKEKLLRECELLLNGQGS
ncbi:MAG TPA: bifunctional ADP-heptose synthase [Chitinophagaceae bacterium]|nr:bifunctional ADP-heptose synthase [Chitinophagaceae bacterium]